MKFTIGFRKATEQDIAFLLDLRRKTMSPHLRKAGIFMSEEQHLERIHEFFNDSHIILRDRKPIGLLKLGMKPGSLHIRQLQILPKCQGMGIGSKVLAVVKKRALQLSVPITLNVLLDNPARALYIRHGFQITKKTKLEYQMLCPMAVIAA
ncbi:GNAT family N-acetyltransferase [Thalassomonas sp. RHCl1]|uniref:GNAT family N-acetyltransferase n=1 Tax=Thalassomonas sp. RHCl1 TaxID=2995320 RepID=UPI00248BB9CF|nr:GNAT family N-acetyltransferase [Thalassomonas sp. RHCl1]